MLDLLVVTSSTTCLVFQIVEQTFLVMQILYNVDCITYAGNLESLKDAEDFLKTITYVKDRLGHSKRYVIDCTKAKTQLGWERKMFFEQGLVATIRRYLNHGEWLEHIQSDAYKDWIAKNYTE